MNLSSSYRLPESLAMPSPQSDLASPAPWRPGRRAVLLGAAALFLLSNVVGIVYFSSTSSAHAPSNNDPAKAKAVNERMLETLGCQSAVHLYQSYLNIGLIADSVEHENCSPAEGAKMLNTVASLMDVVDKQLERLTETDFSTEDIQDIQRIRAISSLMRVQLASLQAYWLSGDRKHADRYHETREKAWVELGKVLSL
jgi:hypothetical protein